VPLHNTIQQLVRMISAAVLNLPTQAGAQHQHTEDTKLHHIWPHTAHKPTASAHPHAVPRLRCTLTQATDPQHHPTHPAYTCTQLTTKEPLQTPAHAFLYTVNANSCKLLHAHHTCTHSRPQPAQASNTTQHSITHPPTPPGCLNLPSLHLTPVVHWAITSTSFASDHN
jgi:hypothetical protein